MSFLLFLLLLALWFIFVAMERPLKVQDHLLDGDNRNVPKVERETYNDEEVKNHSVFIA